MISNYSDLVCTTGIRLVSSEMVVSLWIPLYYHIPRAMCILLCEKISHQLKRIVSI